MTKSLSRRLLSRARRDQFAPVSRPAQRRRDTSGRAGAGRERRDERIAGRSREAFGTGSRTRAFAVALLAVFAARGGALAEEPGAATLLADKAPSIVHLKYVLKRGEREMRRAVAGVLVDATGLVLFSSATLGTGGSGRLKASAQDLRIVFGNDPKEYPSVLVAQDMLVDLAFVQILDLEGRAVTPVDLDPAKGKTPDVGSQVWQVVRKAGGYDYVPVAVTGYVSSRVEKPRPLFGVSGDAHFLGMPVYDGGGAVLGILTRQLGAEGGDEGGMRSGGAFLLPLDAVGKSLETARKRIPEAVEKAKAAKEKEPEPAAMDGAPKEPPPEPKPPDAPGEGK